MTPDELARSGSEHGEQRALFAWAAMAHVKGFEAADDPGSYTRASVEPLQPVWGLRWLHAIHNQGHGDSIRGARAKAEGLKAGVPDIFLPFALFPWHGLYIELKQRDGGRISPEQEQFKSYCGQHDYAFVLAHGWREAANALKAYLRCIP